MNPAGGESTPGTGKVISASPAVDVARSAADERWRLEQSATAATWAIIQGAGVFVVVVGGVRGGRVKGDQTEMDDGLENPFVRDRAFLPQSRSPQPRTSSKAIPLE